MAPSSRFDVRATVVDVAAVLAVALLLVGVHRLVPASLQEALALRYASPDPLHALTAAYVHFDAAHLHGNVVGYLLASGFAYLCCLAAGERRWFRYSFVALLTLLPVAVSLSTAWLIGGDATGRGFSGVVAGFVGLVFVTAPVLVRRRFGYEPWVAWHATAAMTFVVAAALVWMVAGTVPPTLAGLLAVGAGLTLVSFVQRGGGRAGLPADRDGWTRLAAAVLATGGILVVVTAFVTGLFPARLAADGAVTNVLAHYLGLVYGAVLAGWGYRYWSTASS